MEPLNQEQDGLRERKRRDTLQRIAEKGLELFIANGYEETTLDDISAAAGISRRTFFHYFKSKDEILLAWQSGLIESLRSAVLAEATDQSPLDALANALLRLAAPYEGDTAIVMARVIKSSEQLRVANQVKFLQLEHAAFEALCHLWPQNSRRERLRMIAMVGVGVLRVAIDEWIDEGGKRSFPSRLKRALASLRAELDGMPD
ncbi:helix-turn-helix domain-containing protein [Burkholderia sp. BCC1988]|uniref:TetR/AcrR family transcriptional regulator n=1 Tax=Burkholderia sp. BCC1988 TaxID=2817443 RepID=UPI002AB11644|nr:helix-turn-helix domain-containing protein [Burkholderia sp. BCC1988]